jgi:hypothetical protein
MILKKINNNQKNRDQIWNIKKGVRLENKYNFIAY